MKTNSVILIYLAISLLLQQAYCKRYNILPGQFLYLASYVRSQIHVMYVHNKQTNIDLFPFLQHAIWF